MTEATISGDPQIQRMMSKQLRQKAQEFLSSRKKANNLEEIISQWDESNVSYILAVEMIFMEVLRRGDMYLEQTINLTISEPKPEIQYIMWLKSGYSEVWEKLLSLIENGKFEIQQQALSTCFKLMGEEGKSPIEPVGKLSYYFPLHRLKPLLRKIVSPDRDNTLLISRHLEINDYKDSLYFTWRSLPQLTPKFQPKENFMKNLLALIDKIPLPNDNDKKQEYGNDDDKILCGPQNVCGGFVWDQSSAKRLLNKVWSCIMQWELSPKIHKQLLIVLLERVIQHLEKPVLLTDFLMNSLDCDGTISLLALQGVFILVTKHNLEYPNIFKKLYSMFEPEIFHTKYKARLFYLADKFLSSTHLPESLVAAFAKRLGRLTLVAPPEDILVILLFIGNLMIRHPGLKRLIDHPIGGGVMINDNPGIGDPFLMDECDPLLSNAMFSSLWEIRALENHVLPNVSTASRFIRNPLSSTEYDMYSILDKTGGQLFDKEIKKRVKDIMLTFERPNSMELPKGERLLQYWKFTTTLR